MINPLPALVRSGIIITTSSTTIISLIVSFLFTSTSLNIADPSSTFSHLHRLNTLKKATTMSNGDQASTNYKEAFSLFDKRGNGRVALESLGDLLRACGQNPTLAEIRDLEKSMGGDCKHALISSLPMWFY